MISRLSSIFSLCACDFPGVGVQNVQLPGAETSVKAFIPSQFDENPSCDCVIYIFSINVICFFVCLLLQKLVEIELNKCYLLKLIRGADSKVSGFIVTRKIIIFDTDLELKKTNHAQNN